MGDFSARVQSRLGNKETDIIGPHTFDKQNQYVTAQSEGVAENRRLFLGHCRQTDSIPINT